MRLRRGLACVAIVLYLGVTACATWLHVLGDTGFHPLQYFATWDMFPGYRSTSRRLTVVGETRRGAYVRLYPSAAQRWRGGRHADLTRADFAVDPEFAAKHEPLRSAVTDAARRHDRAHPDDRVTTVVWIAETWPARHQLPIELDEIDRDRPTPRRRARRIVHREPADRP